MAIIISTKFTDQNLMVFYGNVLSHYKECKSRLDDVMSIYNEMFLAVQYALEARDGFFYLLEPAEKAKVYKTFNAIFYALPIYQNQSEQLKENFKPDLPEFKVTVEYVINDYKNRYDTVLFDWMLINSITHSCCGHNNYPSGGFPHGGGSTRENEGAKAAVDLLEILAALFVVLIAIIALVLACIALYYMLNEFLEGIERFYYNEGWLRAAFIMANSIAFGAGSTILTLLCVATPLTSLAIMAGISPVGVVITSAVLLSIIGAGIGAFAMNLLYGANSSAPDAMDPRDSLRFRLTAQEEYNLASKGIDPSMVKCALVALRSEIANDLKNKEVPSFFNRRFGSDAAAHKAHASLQKVRELRSGILDSVQVGDLFFDCRLKTPYYLPAQTYTYIPQVEQAFVWQPQHDVVVSQSSQGFVGQQQQTFFAEYPSKDYVGMEPSAPSMDQF